MSSVHEHVLMPAPVKAAGRRVVEPWSGVAGFRVAGWVGAVLVLVALIDIVLAFVPPGFGSPEWEMATISSVIQGLPLISIGLIGLWACGAGLARRWLLMVVGLVFLAAAVCVLVSLVVFATDIPPALRATQDVARMGIKKLVAKTLLLGLAFGSSYIVTGVLALKQARGRVAREAVA